MENKCKDLRNLIYFLEKNIKEEVKYSEFTENKYNEKTYLTDIFDEDNRIVTVDYTTNSITRYILVENNKLLRINYRLLFKDFDDIWDVYAATLKLFSNAKDLKLSLEYGYDGVQFIDIVDEYGRKINDSNETVSVFNRRMLSDGVKIVNILSPVTIDELIKKHDSLVDEIKAKKLEK